MNQILRSVLEIDMYCSTSITMHLLRGLGALALIVAAIFLAPSYPLVIIPALLGTLLLLRGCPMCWLMGLIEKLKNKPSKTLSNEREQDE